MDLFSQDPDGVVVSEDQITIPAEEITPPADVPSVVKLDDTCMFLILLYLFFIFVL
jgi:hypothetical protein